MVLRVDVIKWVFFDVGNVLLNDDALMAKRFEMLWRAVQGVDGEVGFAELLEQREQLIFEQRQSLYFERIGRRYLADGQWEELLSDYYAEMRENYLKYNPPTPGIEEVLKQLAGSFRLGVAANQPRQARDALERLGLLSYFDVVVISGEVGLAKPDSRFFEYLLNEAGCEPQEAVYVGDRVDNDIAPAKSLGMKTILVHLDVWSKGYEPTGELERQYFESISRACLSRMPPQGQGQVADATVTAAGGIPRGLNKGF